MKIFLFGLATLVNLAWLTVIVNGYIQINQTEKSKQLLEASEFTKLISMESLPLFPSTGRAEWYALRSKALILRGIYQDRLDDKWLALEDVGQAVRLNKLEASWFILLSREAADVGEIDLARISYKTALDLDPHNRAFLHDAGLIEAKYGERNRAADFFRRSLDVYPSKTASDALERLLK